MSPELELLLDELELLLEELELLLLEADEALLELDDEALEELPPSPVDPAPPQAVSTRTTAYKKHERPTMSPNLFKLVIYSDWDKDFVIALCYLI